MKSHHLCLGAIALSFATALIGLGAALKIELPPETGVFKPGANADLVNAQCLTCHSVEYVTTQPPLPRAFWKANVEKMQQKFGAPIQNEQIEPMVDYLVSQYGAGGSAKDSAARIISPAPAPDAKAKPPARP